MIAPRLIPLPEIRARRPLGAAAIDRQAGRYHKTTKPQVASETYPERDLRS
jgi:hypothetical protein